MEQNPNTQNNNQQNQKYGNQNAHAKNEGRYSGRDRKHSHDRNAYRGGLKNHAGEKDHSIQRSKDRNRDGSRQGKAQSQALKQSQGAAGGHGRYNRSNQKNTLRGDTTARFIKPKRIETIEDIQADIERIDKDIQFEIKQIKSVKLGL